MSATSGGTGDIIGGGSSGTSGGAGSSGTGTPARRPDPNAPSGSPPRNLGAILAALLAGLIIGGLATAAFVGGSDDDDDDGAGSGDDFAGAIATDRYQAVILSNDKVYFGKLSSISEDFYELDSAFFLRETRESEEAEPVRALLPVNREIHAPENTMLIRKDEVVLVENLAEDSPILTEINRQKG